MVSNIVNKIKNDTGLTSFEILMSFIKDKIKYHITLEEYLDYSFYTNNVNKETFINIKDNTKLIMDYNNKKLVYKIRNKNILYNIFKENVKRKYIILTDDNYLEFVNFIKNKNKIVVSKIDGYERTIINVLNISYEKLYLSLFESNVRFVEDFMIENSKYKPFDLKSEFTLNFIVFKNKIVLRTIKYKNIYYNIDNGKYNNKELPLFKDINEFVKKISKTLDGIGYMLIEVFPSNKGIELISINDIVPIIQNKESLYKKNSFYSKIKNIME